MRKRSGKPQLITDAERSVEEELRFREIRYVIMMSVRALCVVVAAVLVALHVPLLWLWLIICVAGAVVLPWSAVLLANDRAPRPDAKLRNRFRKQPAAPVHPVRSLGEDEEVVHKVIDAD